MFKKEIEFYKNARIADAGLHTFQLCGQMEDSSGERWAVVGEVGYEWLEVHEVGTYFNFEEEDENYDGAFYYVGNTSLEPLRPNPFEIKDSAQYQREMGWGLDYSTKLGVELLKFDDLDSKTKLELAHELFGIFRQTQPGSRIWFELSTQERLGWAAVVEWINQNRHEIFNWKVE